MPRRAEGIPDRDVFEALPSRTKPSELWQFIAQAHAAAKAGPHIDLRLLDPKTGKAYSWALPEKLPSPGEVSLAIRQPVHSADAFDITEITEGYGKGTYKVLRRGHAQVREAGPDKVHFSIYDQRVPEDFALVRTPKGGPEAFILNNTTMTSSRPSGKLIKHQKPDYGEIPISDIDPKKGRELLAAKLDGARVIYLLEPGKFIRTFSYRKPKNPGKTGLIEHTHKVQALYGTRAPDWIPRAGVVVHGELYARGPKGPVPAEIVGGMLNARVPLSIERQEKHGRLRPAIFDVERWGRKDMADAPYAAKLRLLRQLTRAVAPFEMPEFATTSKKKERLVGAIRGGTHRQTREGVVAWDLKAPGKPVKAKITTDYDVEVLDVFPGKGQHAGKGIGGFVVLDPRTRAKTRVGTGLSHAMRHDAFLHPEKYRGLVATITAEKQYAAGTFAKPRLQRWHLDKNEPSKLEKVEMTKRAGVEGFFFAELIASRLA